MKDVTVDGVRQVAVQFSNESQIQQFLTEQRAAGFKGSVHETENKARLALGRCPGVAVERTSVLRDGGALGFALNLTPRLRAAPGAGSRSRGPASFAGSTPRWPF